MWMLWMNGTVQLHAETIGEQHEQSWEKAPFSDHVNKESFV